MKLGLENRWENDAAAELKVAFASDSEMSMEKLLILIALCCYALYKPHRALGDAESPSRCYPMI